MFTIIAGALAALGSVPTPLPLPPPFTKATDGPASALAKRVSDEFKRCGDARTNSNGRFVDAMGTARHSAAWVKATVATNDALTVCRDLRQALRSQNDFLLELIRSGAKQDAQAATARLDSVSTEREALEKFFITETVKYRDMVTIGWGDPHCVTGLLEHLVPRASVCPAPSRRPWATATKAPSNTHDLTTLDFGTLGPARNGTRLNAVTYYARRTYRPLRGAPQIQWTDSASCPALETAIVRLRTVAPPKIDVPGYPAQPGGFWEQVILDGTGYSIDLAPHLRFSTNDDRAPLPKWTDETLRNLEPCWHDEPPADTDARS